MIEGQKGMGKCNTCIFWAQMGDTLGQCGMVNERESRVALYPVVQREGSSLYEMISEDDPRFRGTRIRSQMVTPDDFGCDAWQEKLLPQEPTDEADWWKSS